MARFKDNRGREWVVYIDIPAARRIRKTLDVDILNIDEGLSVLSADPILLCDVLYLLCQTEADSRGVSDEEFGEALIGEALEDACDAFVEALINFSPPRRRKVLQTMQETAITLEKTLVGIAEKKIPEALKQVQQVVSGNELPDSPESSDTNQPEPSES